jgi:hypothetical protein
MADPQASSSGTPQTPSAATLAGMESEGKLVLKFGGSLVEQLGAQLYPSVTATVAELISNAWDADAEHVWISMPLGTWGPDSMITVTDDGHGMTRDLAQRAYLIVGRKRRLEGKGVFSESGNRRVHGRKGIGKLAAFGTAGVLECSTVRDGKHTAFRLDYNAIRKLDPTADYEVEEAYDPSPPAGPESGTPLQHGTRITLSRLLQKRSLVEEDFIRSMARRFAINTAEMAVRINTTDLGRFDIATEFRFPPDGLPGGVVEQDGWAIEAIADNCQVKWWIGFTEKPIEGESLLGISVLANGKMAQRPFLFERTRGTEGQLGQQSIVGEVQADWLDVGVDVEDDLIQSNRDQLQLEDDRLTQFVEWGQKRLAWALRERNQLRQAKAIEEFQETPEMAELLTDCTNEEKKKLRRIAVVASSLPETSPEGLVDLMRSVVDARSDSVVRALIENIEQSDDATQVRMWDLVRKFGLIDARRMYTIVDARLRTIRQLKIALDSGAREVPDLHNIVRTDPWLLDPRWHLLEDEVDMTKFGVDFQPEADETGDRLDFMFALLPKAPATVDEIIVVEIKRSCDSKGQPRVATDTEVDKFLGYVLAVEEKEKNNTPPPRVRGLMVAQGYTKAAQLKRDSLMQIGRPRLDFKTWSRLIDETERMHIGWLEVSRQRFAKEEPEAIAAPPAAAEPMPGSGTANRAVRPISATPG